MASLALVYMFDSRMDEVVRNTAMRHIETFFQIFMNTLFLWHNVPSLVSIPIPLQTST